MHLSKRIGVALAGLLMLGGTVVSEVPAQADAGFVPIVQQAPAADSIQPPKADPLRDPVVNPHPKVMEKSAPDGKGTVKPLQKRASLSADAVVGNYSYAAANDNQNNTGMKADTKIGNPWLSSFEGHTLWEQAVGWGPSNARNYIELGWTKSNEGSSVCSVNTSPCLFLTYWVNGEFQGYNGGPYYHDYQDNTTIWAGINLNGAVGGDRHFRIQRDADGNWWYGYGTGANGSSWFNWIGWVDKAAWGGSPQTGTSAVWQGEVASLNRTAGSMCTDMLEGTNPTTTTGHRTYNMDLYDNASPDDVYAFVSPVVSGRGSVKVSSTEVRMGGPGPC